MGLPPGEVGVDKTITVVKETGAHPHNQDKAVLELANGLASDLDGVGIEKLGELKSREESEDGIVATEEGFDEAIDLIGWTQGFAGVGDEGGFEARGEFVGDDGVVNARVTVDHQDGFSLRMAVEGGAEVAGNGIPTGDTGVFALGDSDKGVAIVIGLARAQGFLGEGQPFDPAK